MAQEGDYGPIPENLKPVIDTVFESSNALTGVVQDFLDISRIEQGRMKYDYTVLDFSRLVRAVAEELEPNIRRKGLKLRMEIIEGLHVYADAGKLRQVIENLVDNSIKYTKEGSLVVRVVRNGRNAAFSITDTGIGIRPETLPNLFRKFSRAEDASKANIIGTGLGLYIARQLIETQKGKVWAESEGEGKGATFTIELPLK